MITTISFAVIASIAIVWHIVSGAMIVNELMTRKQKIKFIIIKFMLPVYAHRYKKITREETGKVGSLFYHYVIAANVALVFALAAIISKVV
jgi:hypothetical protein